MSAKYMLARINKMSCARKRPHRNKEDAEREVRILNRSDKLNGRKSGDLVAYLCANCRLWHVGTKSKGIDYLRRKVKNG